MDDQSISHIWNAIRGYFDTANCTIRLPRDVTQVISLKEPEIFTTHLEIFLRRNAADNRINRNDVCLFMGMYLLGPRDRSPQHPVCPSLQTVNAILETIYSHAEEARTQESAAGEPLFSIDYLVAYGCGWGRNIADPSSKKWEGYWQRAEEVFMADVIRWINNTDKWLRGTVKVRDFRLPYEPSPSRQNRAEEWGEIEGVDAASSEDNTIDETETTKEGAVGEYRKERQHTLEEHAREIITNLHKGCRCQYQRESRRAGTRSEACKEKHDLNRWRPGILPLRNFIARAVKGDLAQITPAKLSVFAPLAFAQSMLFAIFYEECYLRFGNVLYWECPRYAGPLHQLQERPIRYFDLPRCFVCERNLSADTAYYVNRQRLIIAKPSGCYVYFGPHSSGNKHNLYYRCQSKECERAPDSFNHYSAQYSACPHCHAPHSNHPSGVWVYAGYDYADKDGNILNNVADPNSEAEYQRIRFSCDEQSMTHEERQAVNYFFVQKRSLSKTAGLMGKPTAEVQSLIKVALGKLRPA